MADHRTPISPIDWESIWKELDWDNPERQREQTQQLLAQRAAQYAKPLHQARVDQDESVWTLLTFHLGRERYALDANLVRYVRPMGRLMRVPGVPSFYRGVVNIRGQVITLLDLRVFFRLSMDTQQIPREMILVSANDLDLGLLADHVEDVVTVAASAVESIDMRYARGVTRDRVVVLDIEQLFTDDRLIVGKVDES